jgi:hypothetical protein
VRVNVPIVGIVEKGGVGQRRDWIKEIFVRDAWLSMKGIPEKMQAILKGIASGRPGRLRPQHFQNYQPPRRVAVDGQTNIGWINIAIVQHREREIPGGLVQLVENRFSRRGVAGAFAVP